MSTAATDQPVPAAFQAVSEPKDQVPVTVRHAAHAWQQLGLRIRSITPSGLARFLLVTGALGVVGWLFASAWRDMLPFLLGFALAYITLPLVDWLDRYMPRGLAAATVVLLELLGVVLFFGLLIPPIVGDLAELATGIMTSFDPREFVAQARTRIDALPEPARSFVLGAIQQAVTAGGTNIRDHAVEYAQQGANVALTAGLGAFATLGTILGLIAIPTWLVSVMTNQRIGERAVDRTLPGWLRPDFWAVMHILDRTLGVYLRGQFVAALAVGAATFVGLVALRELVWPGIQYPLLLAMIAGILNLIPTLGPILAAIPAVISGAFIGPDAALGILGLYVLIQRLEAMFIQPMIERRSVDIHPAVLVVVLVALSQFGFIWVLLGAPIAVAARDLFRYAYGRLSDPPRPAGVMPDSPRLAKYGRSPVMSKREAAIAAVPHAMVIALPAEIVARRRMRRNPRAAPRAQVLDGGL
jgi:predicted PurR-regulated permease PerM